MKSTDINLLFGCFSSNFSKTSKAVGQVTSVAQDLPVKKAFVPQNLQWFRARPGKRMEAENHDVIITTIQSIPKKWYFGVTLVKPSFFCWLFIYHWYHCIILRWISSTFFNHHWYYWYYCMFHLQVAKWWRLDSRYPPGHLWKNLKSKALSVLIDSEVERSCFFGEKCVRVDSRSWTSKTHVYAYIKVWLYNDMQKWKHCVCVSVFGCVFSKLFHGVSNLTRLYLKSFQNLWKLSH